MRLNIGEMLLKERLITSHQLQEALDHHGRHGGTLSRALVTLGFVKDRDIASLLSVHCCVPTIDIEDFEVNPAIARIIPVEAARRCRALPLARFDATLAIAVADPTNACAFDDIRFLTGYNLEPFVASESALEDAIERCYGADPPAESGRDNLAGGDSQKAGEGPPATGANLDSSVEIDLGGLQNTAPEGRHDSTAARVQSERTAWAYVTAMHAAAVGGPRTPIRGIVEDVEDMRQQLTRERDEARARVLTLERQLQRRKSRSRLWRTIKVSLGLEADLGGTAKADGIERSGPVSKGDAAPPETKTPAARRKAHITLGELLMNENMVSLDQCLEAMRYQKLKAGRLSAAFVKLGFVRDEEITSLLSVAYGIPSIRLDTFEVHPAVIEVLAPETARKHKVLPLSVSTTLTLAVADPADVLAIDAVRSLTGWNVEPVVASGSELDAALDHYYGPRYAPEDAAQGRARGGLRLAWSRADQPGTDPGGDCPAA